MKRASILLAAAALAAVSAAPGPAANPQAQARLADRHVTAVILLQRWAQAIYHFTPGDPAQCEGEFGEWKEVGRQDGVTVYRRELNKAGCPRIVDTNYGGGPSDYDRDITYRSGIRELIQARTVEKINDGPSKVRITSRFSTGDRVEYLQSLEQDPARDENGGPIPGLNFLYGMISQGTVRLANGQALTFELRQTQAFDCFNFFNNADIPEAACREWFINQDGSRTPKPDRLRLRLATGERMTLEFPLAEPPGLIDFTRPARGKLVLGGATMNVSLTTTDPEQPGWTLWRTRGPGYEGAFLLGEGFSGRGQAFRTTAKRKRGPAAAARKGKRRRLHFAARWDRRGIGTVILGEGQTRPTGPTSGLLEFGEMNWAGLAAAFGPTPGL